jgi:regulatory protein
MGIITALEPQQHDPERVSIYIDGHFALGTTRYHVLAAGLRVGQELTEAQLVELERQNAAERAYNSALHFLSYRPRSRDEIVRFFRKHRVDPDAATQALERLAQAGLLDDKEFARFWIENRQQFSPRGSWALRTELRQKGVPTDVIEETLAELPAEESAAVEAGRRRLHAYRNLEEADFRRKMLAFLQRRGFGYEAANEATKQLWLELHTDGEESEAAGGGGDNP